MTRMAVPKSSLAERSAAPSGGSRLDRVARRLVAPRLATIGDGQVAVVESGVPVVGAPVSGGAPAATVSVEDPAFWRRVLLGGGLGAAEAWRRGEWTSPDLVAVLRTMLRSEIAGASVEEGTGRIGGAVARFAHWLRPNTRRGSRRNIHAHYDLGNPLFELFLDETMTYSSGVFETPDTPLVDAQLAKLDRLCGLLDLEPDDHVLEIGTGWGSFALHAAGRYGCRVTTTTISPAQHAHAVRRVAAAGLEDRITVLLRDYRELDGTFDAVASIEMIEAVGHRYLATYFGTIARCLRPGGRAAIQAISMPDHAYDAYRKRADFIQQYIFPGSCCPSIAAMSSAVARGSDLRFTALDDIGEDYVRTLGHWSARFEARIDDVRRLGYDESFIRLWRFYLAYCEAGFAERYISVAQIALSRTGGSAPAPRRHQGAATGPRPDAARVTVPATAAGGA